MKIIKKALAILILLLGAVVLAGSFDPRVNDKIRQVSQKLFVRSGSEDKNEKKDILGEATQGEVKILEGEITDQIKDFSAKIISQETITEATEKVNQIIGEKIEESKDLPQKGIEKVKEEVRKQMYREICEQWLKEN
ncbi:MAG TPA: hypothetical protein VMW29_02585 [Candidatus Bathyarchaeia archaeon]|nr:hypothetical protein [Candidatus Bathyarchaeia archaeon]